MGQFILLLGGARSGKSTFAVELATRLGQKNVLYFATATAVDEEMQARIEHHQQTRPASWTVIEEPLQLVERLEDVLADQRTEHPPVVLLDCLTVFTSNWLTLKTEPLPEREAGLLVEVNRFVAGCRERNQTVIIVSGEVGSGIVPMSKVGRDFRDWLGRLNQELADSADECLLMIAGKAVDLKRQSIEVEEIIQRLR